MPDRDLDADIAFHEFARRRPHAAHDKYANQEVAYRRPAPEHDDPHTASSFASLPEVDDEVIVSFAGNEGLGYQAVAPPLGEDDAPFGPVGLEIDELDDLNL